AQTPDQSPDIPLLSLHDAPPTSEGGCEEIRAHARTVGDRETDSCEKGGEEGRRQAVADTCGREAAHRAGREAPGGCSTCEVPARSEEHTSELQSRENLVCRLLLE